MSNSSKLIGTILALALCLPLHAGKIYKWQDENGSWHYSEKPPLEGTPETIKLKASKKIVGTEGEGQEQSEDEKEPKSIKLPEEDTTPVYTAEEKRANCALASERLKGLESHPRALINDTETGEPRYLTPKEHEDLQKTSKEEIKKFCE